MPISNLSHLVPEARKVAELDDASRISAIQRDRWVNYPRATEALERLERLLQTPKRERMPCMVMHGDSNIGKTLIIAKFMRGHPPSFDASRGAEQRDVIAMQMPATPDQHRFYSALLYELNAPFGARASVSALERLARGLLKQLAPKMLVVDEVHHLLSGSYREQRASLNLLKYLANDLKISVVLVGTSDAPVALQTDAQMSSRFPPFEIPRWRENDDFRRLLKAFECTLPLRKASDLGQRPIAHFMLSTSNGLTGEVSKLLREAASMAIRDCSEKITLSHLEQAAYAPA